MNDTSERPAGDREIDYRGIVSFAIGLVVTLGVASGVLVLLFEHFYRVSLAADPRPTPIVAQSPPQPPSGPRLQAAPARDLEDQLAHEDTQLQGYGWVDRDQGIVHIPIDRALDLMAAGGVRAAETGAK